MEELDLVVVGAGLSGLTAAYYAAKAGLGVLVLERGDLAGSKNLSGGRLYLGPLRGLLEELLEGLPLERKVVVERLSAMGQDGSATLSFRHRILGEAQYESHTVLRALLDSHLAERVAQAGGFVVPQKRVDGLILDRGKVAGIRSDGEEIRAKAVILAEGVLGLLSRELGLSSPPQPREVATALKEVIQLPEGTLEPRFGVGEGQGVAHLFVGSITSGIGGGGFLYTNRDSVSLGLVLRLEDLMRAQARPHELLESFKAREEIASLIQGGRLLEYGAHMIPEARRVPISRLVGDGYLIVGDAAGLSLNMGVTVRGMDMAMASGLFAAKAVIQAVQKQDFSASSLALYVAQLQESFVLKDVNRFAPLEKILGIPRIYREYPELICEALAGLFRVGPGPKEGYLRSLRRALSKGPGIPSLLKDLWAMRKL
jgi:electron transfer flavoprotein-quinone oxidoreductase